jgi:hypothetical protein
MGFSVSEETIEKVRRGGRKSLHPVAVRYYEAPTVSTLMEAESANRGMSFSQFQRIVNQAGLVALGVLAGD